MDEEMGSFGRFLTSRRLLCIPSSALQRMLLIRLISGLLLCLVPACVPVQYPDNRQAGTLQPFETTDREYHNQVKTVRLYATRGTMPAPELNPAVAELNNQQLVLEFDVLQSNSEQLNMKVIHCNHSWSRSNLSDLDFLHEYNVFPINNFSFSIDTPIPYIHYHTMLPIVKLPGNYVALVYRNQNPDEVLLTRRFMVYDARVQFIRNDNPIGPGTTAEQNQQLNFTIHYGRTEVINPQESIRVTIRQNQRWDNAVSGLQPTFIREHQRELEFRFFTSGNLFPAGNEFRFFDLRSLIHPGVNVSYVERNRQPLLVHLVTDRPRADQRYARYPDLNGNFVIANLDNLQPHSAQYVQVRFTLQTPRLNNDVFLSGAFTNWQLAEPYRMTYQEEAGTYVADVLLKQGWYNYQYVVKTDSGPANRFEGNHYETENQYEILVYYRPFQPPADLLIGYYLLQVNHPDR